jgi:hypothetical protein
MTDLRIAEYEGVESTDNSTTTTLGAGDVFTGEWEEIKNYAIIKVTITADQDAAIGGLDFQQSPDQVEIWNEPYNLEASDHKLFTPNPVSKYFRIVYTNGAVAQTKFILQTIYSSVYTKPSSHRLSDTLSGNDDTEVVKSAISFLNEVDDDYKNVGIQNPFPVDGDSVYSKDIWVLQSDMGDFSGSVTDVFDNLHTTIIDSTSNNPKELFIHFNRSIISNVVGLGSFTGDFSNTEIEIYNSGAIATTVIDESADATKYTSRTFQLPVTAGFNAIKFIFHTADTVTLSNSVILKTRSVVARLQAAKPDGTITDINATAGGNLKISLEELENQISSNANSQLNVTQFDSLGNEIESQLNTAFTDNIDGKYGLVNASALYGRVSDSLLVPVKVEGSTQDLQIIEQDHAEIHSGDHYNYCEYSLGEGSGATIELVVTTPNTTKWAHTTFEFYASEGATIELFEGTSGITGGTSITPRNNNRNSINTSALTIIKDPTTITSDGTRAAGFLAGGGRTAGFTTRGKENVLKQNEIYLIRITSLAVSNDISWCGEWYEHTDKN